MASWQHRTTCDRSQTEPSGIRVLGQPSVGVVSEGVGLAFRGAVMRQKAAAGAGVAQTVGLARWVPDGLQVAAPGHGQLGPQRERRDDRRGLAAHSLDHRLLTSRISDAREAPVRPIANV